MIGLFAVHMSQDNESDVRLHFSCFLQVCFFFSLVLTFFSGRAWKHTGIYFFAEQDQLHGHLSNFYLTTIEDPKTGLTFRSSEHYFMYHKCLHFDSENQEVLHQIISAETPYEAKQLGRQVANYNEEEWTRVRYDTMCDALMLKYSQNETICKLLLDTGNKTIYEASPFDKIWGIGWKAKDAVKNPESKYGQNLLGKALIKTRNFFFMLNIFDGVIG